MFRRLRTKLTVLYAGLFGATLLVIAATVYFAVSANAERVVTSELAASGTVFDRLWALRSAELQDASELLSRDFGFREAVASQDSATLQSALENLRQRSGIDLAFSVGLDGKVTASDGRVLGADGAAIASAVQTDDAPAGVAMIDGEAYQAIATPILSPTLTGWVVFAQRMDQREMTALERLSAIPLTANVLDRRAGGSWVGDSQPLAPSERATVGPFIDRALAGKVGPHQLAAADGPAIALVKPLPMLSGPPSAVLLLRYPLARALAPYRLLLEILLAIGAAGLALAFAGSWALAGGVTRPVSALDDAVRRLQRGEAARVVVETHDEIGRLAESFNQMAEAIGERERQITHLAMHDGETDLPNRLALEQHLASLTEAGESDIVVAALSIDRFAVVRGVIGYELAAVLLRGVAARLAARAPGAMIGRLSSDTLGMIFRAADLEVAQAAAAGALKALEAPMRLGESTADVSVTIGLAASRCPKNHNRSPLVCAAIAVSQARAARHKTAVFDADAYGDPAANLSLMSQMLGAIKAGDISVYLQPKYDIRRGKVTGVEALVRWRHPKRGFLSPDLFVPLAEETGHIRPLTDFVLAEAIAHQARMREVGHDLDMSVNISGRLLSDSEFAEDALAMADKATGRMWFEVTETAVIDEPERALHHIERFADAGVGVSIDDYGSGLSSLAYLREMRAEELKIDKAFILGLADSRKNTLLVRSTIDLAHSLGLKVTAEGVETNEAFALLAGMGCDLAQGFLIERPMPLNDVLRFLAEDRAAERRFG
jgi:EAL domain-containing protein (putative c-di-GMP-specific phosphodiesterase class I)/GGDEF domain-containing protein